MAHIHQVDCMDRSLEGYYWKLTNHLVVYQLYLVGTPGKYYLLYIMEIKLRSVKACIHSYLNFGTKSCNWSWPQIWEWNQMKLKFHPIYLQLEMEQPRYTQKLDKTWYKYLKSI